MLNCREIVALFSDFIDGDFNEESKYDFLSHIRECSACGCHFRTFEKTVFICKSLKDYEYLKVPGHIHDGFWEFINTEIFKSDTGNTKKNPQKKLSKGRKKKHA